MPHYNIGLTIDLDRGHDTRRRAEPPWRSWCKSPIWKSIRRHRLAEEPRCRQCAIEGRIVAASHVDHIEPHLGRWLLFFKYENTQSLCAHHHHRLNHTEKRGNSTKQANGPVGGCPVSYSELTAELISWRTHFGLVTWRADVRKQLITATALSVQRPIDKGNRDEAEACRPSRRSSLDGLVRRVRRSSPCLRAL